jgi:cellulose synthase/poly-beta-1,6-N-acetylglucosamine synthase-like glycosyltransferase
MNFSAVIRAQLSFLRFKGLPGDFAANRRMWLVWGLTVTWLAGVGRYWDHPKALWFQYAGLGSVAYVFVLALILFLLLAPLRPKHASYLNILIFVCLTSAPAILYAIPVERFLPLAAAQSANAWFLAIVAAWRVGLLFWFMRFVCRLPWLIVPIAALLPLAAIVVSLSLLNLEHVVFDLMAGIRSEDAGPNDIAYQVVAMLGILAYLGAPILVIAYAATVILRWRDKLPFRGKPR